MAVLSAAACSSDAADAARDGAAAAAREGGGSSSSLAAPIAATRYVVAPLTAVGRVRGTVEIDGTPSPDSVVRPVNDREVCGDSVIDVSVVHDEARLQGAVVWLANVRSGKRLPLSRRYSLTIASCRMEPRTQGVLVGGTLNVGNADRVQHPTRFLRQGTREPVAFAPYSDEGQVVPVTTALERPGLIEARCDLHPWGHAWVAVFDHPYFAVSAPDGAFSLDSVPPGRYTLVAWHPRLGVVRDTVRVSADAEVAVTLRMKAR